MPTPAPRTPLVLAFALGVLLHIAVYQPWLPYGVRERSMDPRFLAIAATFLFIAPMLLTFSYGRARAVGSSALAGLCLSNAMLVIYDVGKDSTNHNLWPLEFIILAVVSLIGYAGAGVGRLLSRNKGS